MDVEIGREQERKRKRDSERERNTGRPNHNGVKISSKSKLPYPPGEKIYYSSISQFLSEEDEWQYRYQIYYIKSKIDSLKLPPEMGRVILNPFSDRLVYWYVS